jgi:hypothetical protein
MRHASLLMLLIALFIVHPVLASVGVMPARQETATPNVLLSSPVGGQALQGVVVIQGNTAVANFQSASLAFSYSGDATGTWFLIMESEAPVHDTIACGHHHHHGWELRSAFIRQINGWQPVLSDH